MNDEPVKHEGPQPLPDPRNEILRKHRELIQQRIREITSDPVDGAVIQVEVNKRGKQKKKRVSARDIERSELKIALYARDEGAPTFFEIVRKKLGEKSKNRPGLTELEELAEAYIENMKKPGGLQFCKEYFDREYGKVPDKIENQISVVQPNLPLMLDDFNRVCATDNSDDPETGRD